MFGFGMPELIIIFVIALIVIGPHKLPDLAKSLGKGLAEFKKASEDFQRSIHEETRKEEVRKEEEKTAAVQPAPAVEKVETQTASVQSAPVAEKAETQTASAQSAPGAEKVSEQTASAISQPSPVEKKESSHS